MNEGKRPVHTPLLLSQATQAPPLEVNVLQPELQSVCGVALEEVQMVVLRICAVAAIADRMSTRVRIF